MNGKHRHNDTNRVNSGAVRTVRHHIQKCESCGVVLLFKATPLQQQPKCQWSRAHADGRTPKPQISRFQNVYDS